MLTRFPSSKRFGAFTLIELLTVIAIIAVLMGLLFPALSGVKDSARKVQAKNDATQITNAVKAYYAEYGRYPLENPGQDVSFGADNNKVMNPLRAKSPEGDTLNPRKIAFMEIPPAKDMAVPKSGYGNDGTFYDPWGRPYQVKIDGNYDNNLSEPGSSGGGGRGGGAGTVLTTGVLVWSLGKDGTDATGDEVYGWK